MNLPSSNFLTDRFKLVLLLWILLSLLFVFVFIILLSVSCSIEVACWERADLLAFLYAMFFCLFVIFQYGVLGQVWYLIVSIPDLCLLSYFGNLGTKRVT